MNKTWTIALIVLLMIINLTSIGFIWWHNLPQKADKKQELEAFEFIIQELKLDSSQQIAYKSLVKYHREEMKTANYELMKVKKTFFDLLKEDKPDSLAIQTALDAIGKAEETNNRITFHHFQQLKAICNTEQQKKLETILKELLGRMKNHPPPPQDRNRQGMDRTNTGENEDNPPPHNQFEDERIPPPTPPRE